MSTIGKNELIDGRYLPAGEIARGGTSVVVRAHDVFLDRPVALKFIESTGADPAILVAEASSLARLRHDNVVQVYTIGPHHTSWYMAMEFIAGDTLAELIEEHAARRAPIPMSRALAIARQVASGLGAAHTAGVIHRDVKPANIVIEGRTGRTVLIDFGIALRDPDDRTSFTVGTPLYMPPEQVDPSTPHERSSVRSDLYSFACVIFELLTLNPVFPRTGDARAMLKLHASAPPRMPSQLRAELAPFDGVFERALAKDPRARFGSAAELMQAIDTAARAAPALFTSSLSSRPPPAVLTSSTLRTLVVDDDEVFRKVATWAAKEAFRGRDVQISAVESGPAALEFARAQMPSLLVLDMSMPLMNGLELLGELRSLPGGTAMRVVVVSASLDEVERWRFRVLGVSDFVQKPVGFSKLIELFHELAQHAGWRFDVEPAASASR
ncbi:MAG: serine/threonine-protein kinase [Polyangiaceae bacterium]